MKKELESLLQECGYDFFRDLFTDYDPDLDVEKTGGNVGIILADLIYEEKRTKELIRNEKNTIYREFLAEARKIGSNNYCEMRYLLAKYFPRRFSERGKQPVLDMGDSNVFGLFNNFINYSIERLQKIKED